MPLVLCVKSVGHLRLEDMRTSGSSSIDLYHGDVYISCLWIELQDRVVESDLVLHVCLLWSLFACSD